MHNSIKAEHKHSTVAENDVRGSNLEDCVQHYVSSRQNDHYSIVVSGFYESWVKPQHGFADTVLLDILETNCTDFGNFQDFYHECVKNNVSICKIHALRGCVSQSLAVFPLALVQNVTYITNS